MHNVIVQLHIIIINRKWKMFTKIYNFQFCGFVGEFSEIIPPEIHTLRELILVGINFRDFREFCTKCLKQGNSRKLIPAKMLIFARKHFR